MACTHLVRVQFEQSQVESQEILHVVQMAIVTLTTTTPDLVPTTYLQIISHSLQSFRPVFERHVKINPFPRTDSTWQKMPEFLQFSTAKIRHHEIRHISLSTWGVWFTLGLVEMPTEERRLVAEDGSKSKNTWLQKIARGWRCLVSSCAGPRHRL